ncbi:MAG TPA: STAS domain-containing protein, partial [Planctomycetota bacterium]|nr:STAS domain-containing protein [Planctomycetota bacterium]
VPYKDGMPIPRLEDMLVRKGHLNAQQMGIILRTRERRDTGGGRSTAAPTEPVPKIASNKLRVLELGLRQETLKIAFKKHRVQGELFAAVLELSGSFDGHTSFKVDEYLNACTAAGFCHLILECARLEYLSSAGIGVLAATIKRCREGKGDLLLCSVDEKMRRVMQIIGLLSLVKTYDTDKAAVASFKTD